MDKWITLHRKGKEVLVNIDKKLEMYIDGDVFSEPSNVTTIIKAFTQYGNYFDESPTEILAKLKESDSELAKAARELHKNIYDYGYKYMAAEDSGIGDAWQLIEDSFNKLEALLEAKWSSKPNL